jgi:hypothetical protein
MPAPQGILAEVCQDPVIASDRVVTAANALLKALESPSETIQAGQQKSFA